MQISVQWGGCMWGGLEVGGCVSVGRRGLLWAVLPAIIRLSLGVSLINAAFLQLTSKVTGIVGTQPLPFSAAPEGGNGHITCFPRGFFTLFFLFPFFSLSVSVFSLILSDCLSVSPLDLPFLSSYALALILTHLFHHFFFLSIPVYLHPDTFALSTSTV